jgi:hypothetical protein
MKDTDERNPTVILFQKEHNGSTFLCRLQVFPDGSIYVAGNDTEIMFEESPESFRDAVEYVENSGYAKLS